MVLTDVERLERHRKKHREYMQKWREENRDRHNESARKSYQRNKHKHVQRNREYHLVRKYGVTQAQYDEMLTQQNGACAICGTTRITGRSKRFFSVDHCHTTGAARGLLCFHCNSNLGWFESNSGVILAYLKSTLG